jgi:hypothetical protein
MNQGLRNLISREKKFVFPTINIMNQSLMHVLTSNQIETREIYEVNGTVLIVNKISTMVTDAA